MLLISRPQLDGLSPAFRPLAEEFIRRLADEGIPFAIVSTLRSRDEQIALYAQGRNSLDIVNGLRDVARLPAIASSENTYTVTKCDGALRKSPHQLGNALDIVPAIGGRPIWPKPSDPRWERIGAIGESCGLDWGGRWKPWADYPHYQLKE